MTDNSMGRDFEKESAPKEHYQRHRPAASDVLRVSHTFSKQLDQKKNSYNGAQTSTRCTSRRGCVSKDTGGRAAKQAKTRKVQEGVDHLGEYLSRSPFHVPLLTHALLGNPSVLLVDEFSTGIDVG